jgi:glycine oxidase
MGQHDAIVVGAGIIGSAIAWRLSGVGLRVALIDPEDSSGGVASTAAGAMLGVYAELTADRAEPADLDEFDFRRESGSRYPDFISELRTIAPYEIGHGSGTFIIGNVNGVNDDRNISYITKMAGKFGATAENVDPQVIPGYKPGARDRSTKAIFLPDEGFVNPLDLVRCLHYALRRSTKVEIIADEVVDVVGDLSRATGVATRSNGIIQSPVVILAAGATSQRIVDASVSLGLQLPRLLRGKGVSIVLDAGFDLPHVIRTPNRSFACGVHVVPRGGGMLYAGATNSVSPAAIDPGKVSAGELHRLLHYAIHEMNTSIAGMNIVSSTFGGRPLTVDRHPLVGSTNVEGLFVATATYRNGILMAPLVAELVADEVLGKSSTYKNPFPARDREFVGVVDPIKAFSEGLATLVHCVQEPDGPLPYDNAARLAQLLRVLGQMALGGESGEGRRQQTLELLAEYPLPEIANDFFSMAQDD